MFNMKIKFSFIGLIIFLLPMLINIIYFAMANNKVVEEIKLQPKWLEMLEQVTRILYVIAICFLVSKQEINFKNPFLFLGVIFLSFYYIVWFRYFAGGMDESLLGKSFLFIPLPLAVFPVLYFICAALWMHNYIALVFMIIFGIAHYEISYLSFK